MKKGFATEILCSPGTSVHNHSNSSPTGMWRFCSDRNLWNLEIRATPYKSDMDSEDGE